MHENNVYRESCHSVSTLLTPCLLEETPWRYVPALELLPAVAHFRHRSRPTWAQQSIILHTVLMLLGNPFLLFLAEGLALRSLPEWLTCATLKDLDEYTNGHSTARTGIAVILIHPSNHIATMPYKTSPKHLSNHNPDKHPQQLSTFGSTTFNFLLI